MRIIFMGTPEFSIRSVEAVARNHELVAAVTQPAKPQGRHRRIIPTAVGHWGEEKNIDVLQPEDLREPAFLSRIAQMRPEAIVVVDFGKILPREVLELPPRGCVNAHASLLPGYRGAAPIEWAIMNGEKTTGVTTILMSEEMDAGDIILQRNIEIESGETAGSLKARMAALAAEVMLETLRLIEAGKAVPRPQDYTKATFAPKITREVARIDWSLTADEIHNKIRALNPRPGAFTTVPSRDSSQPALILKLWQSEIASPETFPSGMPGEIVGTHERMAVATGRGVLVATEVQPQAGRRMTASEYLRGHPLPAGTRLE